MTGLARRAAPELAIDDHIVPALGVMAVKDVCSKHVIELHDRLRDTPSMANHIVAMLSKLTSLAEIWELVPRGRNPRKWVRHYREQFRALARAGLAR